MTRDKVERKKILLLFLANEEMHCVSSWKTSDRVSFVIRYEDCTQNWMNEKWNDISEYYSGMSQGMNTFQEMQYLRFSSC